MEKELFNIKKQKQLLKKDKSNEGKIDEEIINLCNKINSKPNYYTTSSCAGRIILVKGLKEKAKNVFLFKTHKKISWLKLKKELENSIKNYNGLIYFKQEPCLLHVACFNDESAEKLLFLARQAGWKRSGIISKGKRIICELMSTERIEMPIARKKILVDDNFLKILVREANKKLERTREKIKKLEKLINNI